MTGAPGEDRGGHPASHQGGDRGAAQRAALRDWVLERNPGVDPSTVDGRTPLIAGRYLTSPQVADLLLFIEDLRGAPIDVESLQAGAFRDIETIWATFLAPPPR